ncbi:MAG: response regulator transcription factor [Bacteroidia bacterium]
MKILIADDEEDILDLLEYCLENEGYMVFRAKDGLEALKMAEEIVPNLIILDVMMPKLDGMETCKLLRGMTKLQDAVIVFLTARAEEYSELAGFESGADDYLTKPIKPRILLSRIKALMRRNSEVPQTALEVIKVQDLEIEQGSYLVRREKEEISLPRKEFELLYLLASRPGKVFKRDDILDKIWGNAFVTDRTIDVHIRKLREKLGEQYIQTVKGVGYKFVM